MRIYHTETQADYDALMVELEADGAIWSFGRKLSESNNWYVSEHLTCIRVYDSKVNHASLNYYKEEYPDITITKYKAKVDDKMKFTKENVYKMVERYSVDQGYLLSGLKSDISKLDDTPEKVKVKKFVADWIELCKEKANLIDCLQGSYHHYNGSEVIKEDEDWLFEGNNQEVVARAWLDGYEVEKEPLYYIPLPHLETSDGIQQVLSKRKGDKHYFASRPTETLQQRYTKEELERVPEIYKPFAKLIEEEEE